MRAIGYRTPGPIDAPEALLDIELPRPAPGPRDLLVEVRAVSVNPVDTKVRRRAAADPGQWKVLGWYAAGVVVDTGAAVSRFNPGDEVFYVYRRWWLVAKVMVHLPRFLFQRFGPP